MQTEAWRALSPVAQALYVWLKLEWHGPDNNNNGKIRLSVRQAGYLLGVARATAALGFHDLQAKGFTVLTEPASLGYSGAARPPAFELTEIALPYGAERGGRRLYKKWREGHDFRVHKARANNLSGANGKTKSHHKNHDSTVIEMMSERKITS
ncbi:hypothetical protein [Celeribacter sp.]|uniref:hypothetical protein n=1 Tax=Celeribacter sp. TaxID=1890673 RepID=UPI003A8ECA84